ncbi:MAG TPA: hypothetical protein PLF13_12710 [candidate division Zixibacteria bacterium]|nr:hypothetical protein [candidate division Zixibacteria bacterium]
MINKLLLTCLLVTVIAGTTAAAPVVINFQGRLTDDAGDALPDDSYNVVFGIYEDSVGGAPLWSENTEVISHQGLFAHLLGSVNPFPDGLFAEYDRLYVQITAESIILEPRSPITAVPYATVAGDLAARYDNDSIFIALNPDAHKVNLYAEDGHERAIMKANDIGGQLLLMKPEDEIGIGLHAGLTGNQAVILPDSSVSSEETFNEPGLTVDLEVTPVTLITMEMTDLAVVEIEIPEEGYIVLEGKCYVELSGTTGPNVALIQIDEYEGGSSQFPYYALAGLGGYVNTAINYFPIYVTRVYYKDAGQYEFRLEGRANYAAPALARSWDHVLTARYYATDYGPVNKITENPAEANGTSGIEVIDPQNPSVTKTVYKIDLRDQAKAEKQSPTIDND